MRRKSLIYFTLVGASLWLFGLAAWLTAHMDGDFGGLELLRFVAMFLGIGCSFGSWATAVTISSVHKKTWALYLTVALVLLAFLTFAGVSSHTPRPRTLGRRDRARAWNVAAVRVQSPARAGRSTSTPWSNT